MSCGAESNQFELRYIEEITPGTPPATGDMQILRTTGRSGGVNKSGVTSEEIRDDRQISDWIMTKKEPAITINGEFSFSTWDKLLEAAMFTDWSNIRYRSGDVEVLVGDIYELPSGHGLTFLVGQLINVQGFTEAANNGVKEVINFSGDQITVAETLTIEAAGDKITLEVIGYASNDVEVLAGNIYELPSGHGLVFYPGQSIEWAGFTETANNGVKTVYAFAGDQITVEETLTVEAAGDDVTVKYDVLRNGVDEKTFTVEDDFTDVNKTRTMTGEKVNTFGLNMPKESVIGVTVEMIGRGATVQNDSLVSGTPIAPNNNDVMNSGDDVADIYEGGVLQALVDELSLQLSNNLRGNNAVGSTENVCVAAGEFSVTGNLNVYFQDWTAYQKFLDNDASSLRFKLSDVNGAYYFNVPRIKFPTLEVVAGGPNQDVIATGTYQGLLDITTGKTLIVTKIQA